MKLALLFLMPVIFLLSCNKESEETIPGGGHPPMRYTALNDATIKFGQVKMLDLNGDLINDLVFSTILVGDPVLNQDKRKYLVNAAFDVFLLINASEQTPVLDSGNVINIANHGGYNWYNGNSITLAEQIISEVGEPRWQGNWKNANHQYLPLLVRKGDLRYAGWVEVSFHTHSGELVLHRAAISTVPGKNVVAGK